VINTLDADYDEEYLDRQIVTMKRVTLSPAAPRLLSCFLSFFRSLSLSFFPPHIFPYLFSNRILRIILICNTVCFCTDLKTYTYLSTLISNYSRREREREREKEGRGMYTYGHTLRFQHMCATHAPHCRDDVCFSFPHFWTPATGAACISTRVLHVKLYTHTYTHAILHMRTRMHTNAHTHQHTNTCTHAHIRTHTQTHTHIPAHAHIKNAHACTRTNTPHPIADVHTHMHIDTHTRAHTRTHAQHTQAHTHIRTRAHANTHTNTYIYKQLHTRTHTRILVCVWSLSRSLLLFPSLSPVLSLSRPLSLSRTLAHTRPHTEESDQMRVVTPLGLWLVRSDSNHRAPL